MRIIENGENYMIVSALCPVLIPNYGDFLQVQKVRLEKDVSGRWQTKEYAFQSFWGSTDMPGDFAGGSSTFNYNKNGFLIGSVNKIEEHVHTNERYTYRRIPLLTEKGDATGQAVIIFDIYRWQYDPTHWTKLPSYIEVNFEKYVLLRDTNVGKRVNFGVRIEDERHEAYLKRTVTLANGEKFLTRLMLDNQGNINQSQQILLHPVV